MNHSILKGHLDGLILSVLEVEPLHGYAVIEALRHRSDEALDLPSGTIYPALRRLERSGRIAGEWSVVEGRRRRTYRLTAAGAATLARERSEWTAFSAMVDRVLAARP
ncbi:helix-turn-helix transcriptional regulator [Glycomyces sp. A-F 0318]|uniref:helix-turn-helix transcriptional regulator n=1 Tax=Glycomyces amatae TaxID=2881355 RepID=UPI001E418F08|nr:helix-turn-helix transcriptional regulator [Glycomyces amatae]MCD0447447.1 helix-turn-helix transcriptional regulator [Glycomyces amatae]